MLNIFKVSPSVPFASCCYLLESMGEWAVIDPSCDYETALREHPSMEGKLKYVFITHAHFDHIYAIDRWAEKCDRIIVGELDAPSLSDPFYNCYLGFLGVRGGYFGETESCKEGDKYPLGELTVYVIDTPGHTKGGVSYKVENNVFVGDTVFAGGGYGRCDLPGGDEDALWDSIFKLFSQNMIGNIYPGHGEPDTFENSIKYYK